MPRESLANAAPLGRRVRQKEAVIAYARGQRRATLIVLEVQELKNARTHHVRTTYLARNGSAEARSRCVNMDQYLLIGVGVALSVLGFFLKRIKEEVDIVKQKQNRTEINLARNYETVSYTHLRAHET